MNGDDLGLLLEQWVRMARDLVKLCGLRDPCGNRRHRLVRNDTPGPSYFFNDCGQQCRGL